MIIGVPKEIKNQEYRVALPPSAAWQLTKRGHQVLVQRGAGKGSGFPDREYALAGATLVDTPAAVFDPAELIVKVKEPQPSELPLLRPGQILFTFLHLAADRSLTDSLLRSGVTAIAYETIEVNGRLPLLEPMSEIAGRMSVLVGGYYLAKHYGGSGTLLGGVPGVLAGKVVVLGGGSAGINAARMATGLGADVTILEVDIERMRYLDITLHSAHTLYSDESRLLQMLPGTDLLIGAVLVPGARAPRLIRRDMLRLMRPGSVFVDIAIDQGGCAETSRPTNPRKPRLRRGRRHALLRFQHARSLRPHRHPGPHQRHLSLRRNACRPRPPRSLPSISPSPRRHQHHVRPSHPPRRRPCARPAMPPPVFNSLTH